MKIRNFVLSALALMGVVVSCQETPEADPAVSVDVASLEFSEEGGSQTISFTSAASWELRGADADWIAADPTSGKGSSSTQTITVEVTPNSDKDREATLTIYSSPLAKKSVTVTQKGSKGDGLVGDGSANNPYNVASAIAFTSALTADVVTTEYYYIKGYVSRITQIETANYGNANFYITDSQDGSGDEFYCFQLMYLNGAKFTSEDQLKTGDEVVVYAQLVNYKGNTPETNGKGSGKLYSINGQAGDPIVEPNKGTPSGTGTEADPFNATAAIQAANALAADVESETAYYIKGFVKSVKSVDTGTYGNANFYITDTAAGDTEEFYCFQIMYLNGNKFTSADQIKAGDEVVVYAKIVNYKGNTPETVGKGSGKLYSINGQKGDVTPDPVTGTPSGDGSEANPYNATAALQAASALAADTPTEQFYYIRGFVKNVKSVDTGDYGNANFTITDTAAGDTEEFYCFQIMYIGGAKFTSTDQLAVGDEVVVYAQLVNYKGNTPETNGKGTGKIVSINGNAVAPDYISATPAAVTVNPEAGATEIKISANVAWTVASDNADFTVSPASGEGNGTVTVTYTANAASEARTAKITVSSSVKNVEVVVTQKAKPTEGASQDVYDFSTMGLANASEMSTVSEGTSTIEFKQADATNTSKYYNTGTAVRCYPGSTITITSTKTIKSIEFTSTEGDSAKGVTTLVVGDADCTAGWSGSEQTVTFKVASTKNGHRRISKIVVNQE